jgi:hypothetical protein
MPRSDFTRFGFSHERKAMHSYQHTQNRRRVVIGGAVIMAAITVLSCVSSFAIYRQGFADFRSWAQNSLGLVGRSG